MTGAKYKGTTIKTLYKLFQTAPEALAPFLASLTPDARHTYETVLPHDWMPIEIGAELMSRAAEFLFPGRPDGLRQLGYSNGMETLQGIYRIFLRIPSVNFVLQRLANIWGTFFDTGEVRVLEKRPQQLTFVVNGFPDYPEVLRESICGFMIAVLELTGARQIQVTRDSSDPQAWKWVLHWEGGK